MGARGTSLKLLAVPACAGAFGVLASAWLVQSCTVFSDATVVPPEDAGTADVYPAPAIYLPFAEGARVCATAAACPEIVNSLFYSNGVPVDSVNFSQCMSWVAGPLPPSHVGIARQREALQCLAGATTCPETSRCLAYEVLGPADPRCADADGGTPPVCLESGAATLTCAAYQEVDHCTAPAFAPGSSCLQGTDGVVYCAFSQECLADSCAGFVLHFCREDLGLTFGYDCEVFGNTCGTDSSTGFLNCLTDGHVDPCDSPSYTCDQARVKVCQGAAYTIFDCAEFGATCSADNGPPRCVRPTDQCTPFDVDVNVCEGSTIKLCVGGERIDFDCGSIGKVCEGTLGAACK